MTIHLMYGGTFDPIHDGHLGIALAAHRKIDAEVFITPAADPPHRDATQATAEQRAEMVRLAIEKHDGLHLDLRELHRDGPSYTVDTLLELREELPTLTSLAILIGADSFLSLRTWSRWEMILELAHIVVAERPGQRIERSDWLDKHETRDAKALKMQRNGLIYRLKQRENPASATAIRNAIANHEPDWDRWLAAPVADFVRANRLYGYAPANPDLN